MSKLANIDPANGIRRVLDQAKDEIAKALPKHLTADRMARIALTEIRMNPKLQDCEPTSFLGAIIQTSQLGLEPGNALGHAYLIPFRNNRKGITECNLMVGYKGYIQLAKNSGVVKDLTARCVYEGDEFEVTAAGIHWRDRRHQNTKYELIDVSDGVRIKKAVETPPIIAVFASADLVSGGKQWDVLDMAEVIRAMESSKNSNEVWSKWFTEMARKTAVRRLAKYLPLSPEMRDVAVLESLHEEGRNQGLAHIVDTKYIPDHASEDATTIAQVNREAEKERQDGRKAQLLEEIKRSVIVLRNAGAKDVELCRALTIKTFDDLKQESVSRLEAALDVLLDWDSGPSVDPDLKKAPADNPQPSENKTKQINQFHKLVQEMRELGYKETELLKALNVGSLTEILLKPGSVIEAANSVLSACIDKQ